MLQRGRGRLYLTGNLDLTSDLDVVIIVVGVRSDPEAAFLQSCGEKNPIHSCYFKAALHTSAYYRRFSQRTRAECARLGPDHFLLRRYQTELQQELKVYFLVPVDATSAKTKQKQVCSEDKKKKKKKCLLANRFRQKNPSSHSRTHANKKRNA